jgi:hypothetical protein
MRISRLNRMKMIRLRMTRDRVKMTKSMMMKTMKWRKVEEIRKIKNKIRRRVSKLKKATMIGKPNRR